MKPVEATPKPTEISTGPLSREPVIDSPLPGDDYEYDKIQGVMVNVSLWERLIAGVTKETGASVGIDWFAPRRRTIGA